MGSCNRNALVTLEEKPQLNGSWLYAACWCAAPCPKGGLGVPRRVRLIYFLCLYFELALLFIYSYHSNKKIPFILISSANIGIQEYLELVKPRLLSRFGKIDHLPFSSLVIFRVIVEPVVASSTDYIWFTKYDLRLIFFTCCLSGLILLTILENLILIYKCII